MVDTIDCLTAESYRRLAAIEALENNTFEGAPFPVLVALDKLYDAQMEIFEMSVPSSREGVALKLRDMLAAANGSVRPDGTAFPQDLVSKLSDLQRAIEDGKSLPELQAVAKRLDAAAPKLHLGDPWFARMLKTAVMPIEFGSDEFGDLPANAIAGEQVEKPAAAGRTADAQERPRARMARSGTRSGSRRK